MPVPFFGREDNATAFKKMKVMFVIKRIRNTDLAILMTWIVPFFINLIFFHLINGENSAEKLFCPFGSVFRGRSKASIRDWGSWYGGVHVFFLILTVFFRAMLSMNLWSKMKDYQQSQTNFKWNPKNRFWLVVCLPFISFVIYPVLLKLTKFELIHKYNL